MNDTIGLTYDCDAALRFAAHTTGLHEEVVRAVLRSKDRYHLGLGIMPADIDVIESLGGDSPGALRAAHPRLFPDEHIAFRYLSPPLEREFITRDTRVNEETVRTIIAADVEYMRRCGIID